MQHKFKSEMQLCNKKKLKFIPIIVKSFINRFLWFFQPLFVNQIGIDVPMFMKGDRRNSLQIIISIIRGPSLNLQIKTQWCFLILCIIYSIYLLDYSMHNYIPTWWKEARPMIGICRDLEHKPMIISSGLSKLGHSHSSASTFAAGTEKTIL